MHHTSRTGVRLNRSRAPRGGMPEDAVLVIHKVKLCSIVKMPFHKTCLTRIVIYISHIIIVCTVETEHINKNCRRQNFQC